MDYKTIILFVFSALQLVLCAGLFGVARSNKRARCLAISILPSFFWSLFIGLFLYSSDSGWSHVFVTAYYIAAALLPPCYMYMAYVFTDRKMSRSAMTAIVLASVGICAMVVAPGNFIESLSVETHEVSLSFVPYLIYSAYFMFFYITSLALIISTYIRKRRKSLSLGLFLASWLVMGGVGTVFNLFLPLFDVYSLIWIGPLGLVMLIPMAFRIATTNEHFSAIKTFARGLLYCIFGFFCLAFSFLALYSFNEVVVYSGNSDVERYALGIVIVGILAIMLLLFYHLIQKLIKEIDSDGFNEVELISAISRITASKHDPRDFFRSVRSTLIKAFGVSQVEIMVFGEYTTTDEVNNVVEDTLVRLLSGRKRHAVYLGDIRNKMDFEALQERNIEVVVPIVSAISDRVIGAIILSPRKQRKFDRYYGKTLENLSAILAPFIQSSVYHKEILRMNSKMKDEISRKTQKLRESNKELLKLDDMKDDLLTITSHNLRTPLTSIMGFTEMLLDEKGGKLNSAQKSYAEAIMRSGNTMRRVVSDLLDVSHIDSGDFVLNQELFCLTTLVSEEIANLREFAAKKGRDLIYEHDDNIEMIGDAGRMRQVIINMIDNAIFYGKHKVKVKLHRIEKGFELRVTDDGIGIPKAEQPKIFTKMFRASNAGIVRPDGTGVGLFVSKNVIEATGGEVIFESVEGKGSTFGFRILNK